MIFCYLKINKPRRAQMEKKSSNLVKIHDQIKLFYQIVPSTSTVLFHFLGIIFFLSKKQHCSNLLNCLLCQPE